jgi:mono/diheme cytochrome c family protein
MKKYIVLLLILVSCGKKSALIFKPNDATTPLPLGQAATFENIKSTILTPHCLACHANVTTAAELNKWIVPGNPEASVFFKEVEDGSMPMNAAPLPTSDLELIRSYIQSLVATPAPVPTPTPIPTPTPTPVTFAEIKQQVLTPYSCLNCHGVGTEAKIAKWINITTPAKSLLYTRVHDGSMPRGGGQVPAAQQALLLKYVQGYAAVH